MNIFEDVRFVKKLNSIIDLIDERVLEIPKVRFTDYEGFGHKFEFLWFKVQNCYWMGHVAYRKSSVHSVEHWTFDGETREMKYGPKCRTAGNADRSIECVDFDMDELLKRMDLVIVELI